MPSIFVCLFFSFELTSNKFYSNRLTTKILAVFFIVEAIARNVNGKPLPTASGALLGCHGTPNPKKGKRLNMANRTRNKAVTLRMTEEEYSFFQTQMKKSEANNQTDFFLDVLRKKQITVIDDLVPLLVELKRQGNNLNQIARQLNEKAQFGTEAEKVMNECFLAYKKLIDLKLK